MVGLSITLIPQDQVKPKSFRLQGATVVAFCTMEASEGPWAPEEAIEIMADMYYSCEKIEPFLVESEIKLFQFYGNELHMTLPDQTPFDVPALDTVDVGYLLIDPKLEFRIIPYVLTDVELLEEITAFFRLAN